MRPDAWDGLPVEVVEHRENRCDIPLDHLTAADNEYRRTVFVTVYRDVMLGSRYCSGRRWILRTLVPPAPTGMPEVIAIVSPGAA